MSDRSWTSGANPLARRWSTHFVQHPHEGSLYTVIDVGAGAPAPTCGSSAVIAAPPRAVVAMRAIQARRVSRLSFIVPISSTAEVDCGGVTNDMLPQQAKIGRASCRER